MNINNFLHKENLNTLWDVISDEDIFKFLSRDIQNKIAQLFTNNVNNFFEIEKTKTNNLVDINKKYILLDGAHRIVASYILGKKNINAYVITL